MFFIDIELKPQQQKVADRIAEKLGVMPPQWKLLLYLNPKRFEIFMEEIEYLLDHPHIEPDFFAFIRLGVADREGFSYCKSFNTKLLLARGYERLVLKEFLKSGEIPFDEKHKLLMQKVLKALYEAVEFGEADIDKLKGAGWSDEDIFDAIDHGAFLFKYYRVMKAYMANGGNLKLP